MPKLYHYYSDDTGNLLGVGYVEKGQKRLQLELSKKEYIEYKDETIYRNDGLKMETPMPLHILVGSYDIIDYDNAKRQNHIARTTTNINIKELALLRARMLMKESLTIV